MSAVLTAFMHVPQFFFTWSIFFGAGLAVYLFAFSRLKRDVSLKALIKDCVPFNPVKSKSFHMDVKTYVITKLSLFMLTVPGFAIYAYLSGTVYKWLHVLNGSIPPEHITSYTAFFCAAAVFLSAEFAYYIVHYTNHRLPFLWELHKVHHSADVLNPLTNTRAHSVDQAYKFIVIGTVSAVPTGMFMFYYGFGLPEIVALTAIANKMMSVFTLDTLRHSHVRVGFGPFDRVFVSPHLHHIHHSSAERHIDKNFGLNLSVFDWVFGTLYRPSKGEIPDIGMYGYSTEALQEFNTLWGAYVTPLKRSFQALMGSLGIRTGDTETNTSVQEIARPGDEVRSV